MSEKALVLFSGGVDSTTCLGLAIDRYGKENVIALSVSYGQKHEKEIEASRKIAEYYGVEHLYLDLGEIFQYSNCSLLSHSTDEIPEEAYAEQLSKTDGKPVSTYVPFRNGLFLSSAASIALSKECSVIYYGAHSDDAAGSAYPDCSDAFNNASKKSPLSDLPSSDCVGHLTVTPPAGRFGNGVFVFLYLCYNRCKRW